MIFTFNSRVASSSCGDKHHVGILWEDKHGPHMVHSLLDGLVQSKRLVSTCDEDHHLGIRKQACDGGEGAAKLEVDT